MHKKHLYTPDVFTDNQLQWDIHRYKPRINIKPNKKYSYYYYRKDSRNLTYSFIPPEKDAKSEASEEHK